MTSHQNINPYLLFGLTSNSSLKELRKTYYDLSLCCHPDKGGNNTEMIIVHNAYLYIKNHLNNCREQHSYEDLENDFEDFCKSQTIEPPSFRDIYDNYNDFSIEFNKEFNKRLDTNSINENESIMNPFSKGYGDMMLESNNTIEYSQNEGNEPVQDFGRTMILYNEPNLLPDSYGNFQQLNNNDITDFSHSNTHLSLSDYKKAFSEIHMDNKIVLPKKTLDDIINERELLDISLNQNKLDNTPILDIINQKKHIASIMIQKIVRGFLKKKQLHILYKINDIINVRKIPFENYLIILQRNWRYKLQIKYKIEYITETLKIPFEKYITILQRKWLQSRK